MRYRPWGQFQWLLEQYRYSVSQWDLFGCLSTEERCLSVRNVLHDRKGLRNTYLANISDADSIYSGLINELLEKRVKDFVGSRGTIQDVKQHYLFDSPELLIKAVQKFLETSNGNIVVDISSLPKRFFFIIIKVLLQSSSTQNLIATYTVPKQYRFGEMTENFEPWRPLPTFGEQNPDASVKALFVGVGHNTMSLPEQFESVTGDLNIHIFIPFPGHPQSIKRNWQFVRNIEKASPQRTNILRTLVNARDVSESYNNILVNTDNGRRETLLVPYGPKPVSLAMCLYACQSGNSRVYYTQPRVYPPDYSLGVDTIGGAPRIYGYCIKIEGQDQFTI